MSGADGNVVGSIKVRVKPDLTGFRQELEAKLEAIENALAGEIDFTADIDPAVLAAKAESAARAAGTEVEFRSNLDASRLAAQTAAAARAASNEEVEVGVNAKSLDRFQQRMLNQLRSAFSKIEAKLELTPDGEYIRRSFEATEKKISDSIRLKIPVDLDEAADMRSQVQRLVDKAVRQDKLTAAPLEFDEFQFSEKAKYRFSKQVDTFIEEQRKKELTFENTQLSDKAMFRMGKQIDNFFEERFKRQQEVARKAVQLDVAAFSKRNERVAAQVEFGFKLDDFERDVQRAKLAAERAFADLDAKLGIRVENGEIIRLRKDLESRFANRPVTVPVKIDWDRNLLTRSVSVIGGGTFSAVAKGFYTVGGAAINAVRALARLRQGTLLVLAVLALIAPALALISGLLVTLPAAFAAITVPIAAVALGLDGIKKAAEVSKAEFEALRQVMNDRWQANLTPVFQQLNQLGPMLRESMPKVADGMTAMAQGFADAVTSKSGMDGIRNTIENIGEALARSKQGVTDFTNGLINLVSALSDKFPGLADAFNRTGKSFLEWVDKITEKGPDGVSQLDAAMKSLGDTLTSLNGLLGDFFRSGWDNLTNGDFAGSMKGFVETLRSLVQDTLPALARGFEGIASALKPVAAIVSAIDTTMSTLGAKLPDINDFKDELSGGSVDKLLWGDKIGGWIEGLRATVKGKTQEVGQEAAVGLAEGLAQGLDAGAALGATSFNGLDKVGQAVSEQIKNAVKVSNEDQKQALLSAFTAGGVDSAVSQQLTQQVNAAVQGAKNAMTNLGPELQAAIDTALLPLATIADKVGQAFSTMGPVINQAFIGAMSGVRSTVTGLFAFLELSIGTQTSKIGNSIAQGFASVPSRIGQSLAGVPQAIASALSPVIGVVQSVMTGVINVVQVAGQQVAAVGAAAFAQFPPAVQGAMAPAITTVSTICQQMVDTAMSYASVMENAGRAIGSSFAAGLASSEGLVSSAAAALMQAARNMIPSSPAKEGPFSGSGWVDNSGQSVGEAFAQGMQGTAGQVVGVARVLMQQVKDVFGNAEGVVFNFNFNGVNNGITQSATNLGVFSDQLSSVNTQVADLQKNLGQAVLPDGLSPTDAKQQSDYLRQQLDLLEIQRKQLELQKVPGADNTALKAQLEQIRLRKVELGLQKNQLDYALKYGGAQSQVADIYSDQYKDLARMPLDFGKAVSGQFMNDLGFGGGALPTLANQALDWGSQIVFNVANMDDALMGQKRFQTQQAIGMIGR